MEQQAAAGKNESHSITEQPANTAKLITTATISVEEQRDELLELTRAVYQASRTDEKGECWTIRAFLEQRNVYDGSLSGGRRLIEEACRVTLDWIGDPLGGTPER